MRNYRCCQRSMWCVLDNLLHASRLHVAWICDRHERDIAG